MSSAINKTNADVTIPSAGRTFAQIRGRGLKAVLEILFNFVLPFAIYNLASSKLGNAPALMAASAPPVLWSVAIFIRERKLDAISILVLSGIALSLVAFAGGGGVKFLQLRETLVGGLVGLIFLGSAAIGRPLIFQLAKAGARRRSAESMRLMEAVQHDKRFRADMLIATLVWGFGLLSVCAISSTLVFVLTIKQFLLVSAPIGYVSTGLLTAWTFWYVPRARAKAAARIEAAGGS